MQIYGVSGFFPPPPTQQIFSAPDTNGNGQLSPEELAAAKHGPHGWHGQGAEAVSAGDSLLSQLVSSDSTDQDSISRLLEELDTSQSDGSTTTTVSTAALRQLTASLEQLSTSRTAGAAPHGIYA